MPVALHALVLRCKLTVPRSCVLVAEFICAAATADAEMHLVLL
jgi:hypothetical protein